MSKIQCAIETVQLTATAWAEFPDVNEVKPINRHDHAILAEIRDVLVKHGAIDRFGVNLLHRHFDLNDDEILFETTDVPKRSQRIEVRPASDIANNQRVLDTQWVFNCGRPPICVGYCDYNKGHRHIHQTK